MTKLTAAETVAGKDLQLHLTLFVAGNETNSRTAKENLRDLVENELNDDCQMEIVDVLQDFTVAAEYGILVTPTLLIQQGGTQLRVIGNLSDREKIRRTLGLENT